MCNIQGTEKASQSQPWWLELRGEQGKSTNLLQDKDHNLEQF